MELLGSERATSAFNALQALTPRLNKARDLLTIEITAIEEKINQLNLGVSSWVVISHSQEEVRALGFSKVEKTWGLALRLVRNEKETTIWKFNNAPSWLRAESVNKIPALSEHLITRVEETIELLNKKISEAREISSAFPAIMNETPPCE